MGKIGSSRVVGEVCVALLLLLGTVSRVCCQTARAPACQTVNGVAPVCTCNQANDGTIVECNARSLSRIPTNIPEDTVVLNLASNQIRQIRKSDLMKLENLRTLFLQENLISFIEEGAFNNLYYLQLIVLGNNRLTSIPMNVFQHLPSLSSIDLTNNRIYTIDKRAFLTLPASTNTNGVFIQLSSNRIVCDCNARALRDWKNSLSSRLSPINFSGFQCTNANNVDLDSMADNAFPTCNSTQLSVFERQQTCISCRRKDTQETCDTSVAGCFLPQPMCQTQVQVVNRKMEISKQCGAYEDCLLREQANAGRCNVSSSSPIAAMLCTFCCVGTRCNDGNMGGRTSSYELFVGLRINRSFEAFMLDPNDPNYIRESVIYTQKLKEVFLNADGGYDVTFLSFRNESPNTYVSLLIYTTSMYWVTQSEMTSFISRSVRTSEFYKQLSVSFFYVGSELGTAKKCMAEVTQTEIGRLTWQEASTGSTANVACRTTTEGITVYATRRCVRSITGVAQWEQPNVDACLQSDTTNSLTELNNTEITPSNVNTVLTQLDTLTSQGGDLTATDVVLTMETVDKAMATPNALNNLPALDSTVHVLSNMMDSSMNALTDANRVKNSASKVLSVADQISAEGKLSSNGQLKLTTPNLVVAAVAVNKDNFDGLTLMADDKRDGSFNGNDVKVELGTDIADVNTTRLVLPPSVLTAAPGSRIAMKALVSDKLFRAIRQSKTDEQIDDTSRINSHVLDATVVGQTVENLKDPIVMGFAHINETYSNPSCVFWDIKDKQWSSRGCVLVVEDSSENVTTCHCDHLTNFALLMDVYGEGSSLSDTDKKILSVISYIGCGVSLLSLVLTLITYALFKKLRRDNPSKILINLCVALAFSNLVFVAGMQPYAMNNTVGCKIVAVLLHFFLLSALSWMAVEAFYMYLALVLVFKTYFTNFLLKCSLVGWGIPLVIVAITLGVNSTDNYGPLKSGICWLEGIPFYAGFVGPVCLILFINFIAFALVLRQIIGLAERKLSKSESVTTGQQLRGAIGVAILLGLTWIFAVFAIDSASVIFYYLFAIFNSLQGLWIFLFYCVLKRDARKAWMRMLPCCETVDDKSGVTTSRGETTTTQHHRLRTNSITNGNSASTSLTNSTTVKDSDAPYDNITSNGTNGHANKYVENSDAQAKDGNMKKDSKAAETKLKPGTEATQLSDTAQTNHAHINLVFEGDETANLNKNANNKYQQPSNSPATKRTDSRPEYHQIPVPKACADRMRSPSPVNSSSPPPLPVNTKAPGNMSGSPGEDAQKSPRPLHFKVGYTLSRNSTEESEVDNQPDKRVSVQAMITKLECNRS